jgi:hypothetical protein
VLLLSLMLVLLLFLFLLVLLPLLLLRYYLLLPVLSALLLYWLLLYFCTPTPLCTLAAIAALCSPRPSDRTEQEAAAGGWSLSVPYL